MESSKAATGLACSPQNHSVLVRLQHGGRLHEGDMAPWALLLWGGGKRGEEAGGTSARGSETGTSLGWSPAGWCRCSRYGTTRYLQHRTTALPFPAFIVVIWGESFDSRGMPLGFELPPVISSRCRPRFLPWINRDRIPLKCKIQLKLNSRLPSWYLLS